MSKTLLFKVNRGRIGVGTEIRVKPESLFNFCSEILTHIGVRKNDADIITENLILANLRGIDSHGIVRLPSYIRRVQMKLIDPQAAVEVIREGEATALIDAHNSFGQVAAMHATLMAADKAKKFGVAVVGVRNSNHFGMAAYYVLKLIEHKLIGIALSNAPPAIAPWGAKTPMFGTNPICIGFPARDKPLVLDMAVSTVARGKIRLAALTGEKIPDEWAFDKEGKPTTDPKAALLGTLVPIGGAKGYGLALSIDMLCGVLMDSVFGWEVKETVDLSGPSRTSFFIEAIKIESFRSYEGWEKKIADYTRIVKEAPRKNGVKEILLPDEREAKEKELRKKLGIPIDKEVLKSLKNLANEMRIPFSLP